MRIWKERVERKTPGIAREATLSVGRKVGRQGGLEEKRDSSLVLVLAYSTLREEGKRWAPGTPRNRDRIRWTGETVRKGIPE
jgi:hypothetical protein